MTADQYILQPTSAPCYSGGFIRVKSRCVSFDSNRTYCVVFEDDSQMRYVVSAKVFNVCCLVCPIPPVLKPSSATLTVIAISSSGDFEQMMSARFAFTSDPIDPLAAFLAKSANCLDCDISVIEKVSNGLMGAFDAALSVALTSHTIEIDPSQHTPRLTLLHLVAYLGLEKTLNRLIVTLPGCLELLNLKAPNGFSPVDLADGPIGDWLSRLSQADIQALTDAALANSQIINGSPMVQDVVSTPIAESLEKLTAYCEELRRIRDENNEPSAEASVSFPSSPLKEGSENGRASTGNMANLSQFNSLIDHLYNAVTAISDGDVSIQRIAHSRSFSDIHTTDNEETPEREVSIEPGAQPRRDSASSSSTGLRRRNSLPSSTQRQTSTQDQIGAAPTPGVPSVTSPPSAEDDDKPNWSEWCAEHHPALLSSLNSRQRKLQDSIWEFIRTEHHHLRILNLLDRVYRRPLKEEFNMDDSVLTVLFPNLNDLMKEHGNFLAVLRNRQKERLDRQIHTFSDILLGQFTGERGAAFSNLYAKFILHQYPAKKKYDELYSENKDFVAFVAKCKANEASQRMGIPECRLRITQRITQMPLLVQAICKYVTDEREKEEMNRALCAVRQVAAHVNEQLDRQTKREKLASIKSNFDVRSTCTFQGRKFGKGELSADGRQLRFYGTLQLRTSRGYREVLCLLMTDVFVLLSESTGETNRYALFTSGNRQPVLSLRTAVVRAAVDGAKSKTIYLVSPGDDDTAPADLYEFKCPNTDNWREWLRQLKEAVVDAQMGLTNGSNLTPRNDTKSIFSELSTIQQQIDELCSSKSALLREAFSATRLDDIRNSTRLAIEASSERVLNSDRELRELIEDMQKSFELADLSSSRQRMSGSVTSVGSSENGGFDLPDWRALTSTWLSSLHGILASVSDLQRENATQKQQLADIRLHPSYLAKLEELREEDMRLGRLRDALQQDREELLKKRTEIDNSLMYLSDTRKQHKAQCERETAEIEREKEALRVAKEKLAQQKEVLQRQTDLNLQERANVEKEKSKLKQQQQQMQEQQQHHALMAEQLVSGGSPMQHQHQTSPPLSGAATGASSLASSRNNAAVHSSSSIPHHLASFSAPSGNTTMPTQVTPNSMLTTGSSSSNFSRGGSANSSSSSITPSRTSGTSLLLPSKLEEQPSKKKK